MEYLIEFSEEFEKSMKKLKKKDKTLFLQIQKKLLELINNPEHYKPLSNVLAGFRRIHFGSFVLIFKIEGNTIKIISLDHHDNSY
ncbi:type II toxin-antitoxin system mRNA interferase toxin, RelE/StbE family [Candidatus Woesearchaeota archaeon]|nr:type II toxin-antitoxin system mRNA interferase toxin, RelE/StbE family [Candidatus Woesearchaeota archaeon]